MIDVHHHCLPGVDDGPRDLPEAIDLCQMALDEGITTIIATPHVLRGRWRNVERGELEQRLSALQEHFGTRLDLRLGSEYFFSHDMADALATGSVVPLAGSRYVLFEFDTHSIPPFADTVLYAVRMAGWTPVIAHPERNAVLQNHPDLLARLIRSGAKTQVTASSVLGSFGSVAERVAREWIRDGAVHFLATDAHNRKRRPAQIREATAAVADLAGTDVADALVQGNPQAVLENRELPYDPDYEPRRTTGLFDRLKRFLLSTRGV